MDANMLNDDYNTSYIAKRGPIRLGIDVEISAIN